MLRLDAPGAPPILVDDAGYVDLVAGTFAYAIREVSPSRPALRALDLHASKPKPIYASLEPNRALGQTIANAYGLAYDDQRVVAIDREGSVYVSPVGTTGSVRPLTWVDEAGTPTCPVP